MNMHTPEVHPDALAGNPAVPSIRKFRNVLENGNTVESIAPMPATKAATTKHYFSTVNMTNFCREDGKRIHFRNHYCETDLYWDQVYLENEISNGNPYLRHANEKEVETAHMLTDPRGTITSQVREQLKSDPDLRAEIEAEILAKMSSGGKIASDSEKLAGAGGKDASSILASAIAKDSSAGVKVSEKSDPATQGFRLGGVQNSSDISKMAAQSGK